MLLNVAAVRDRQYRRWRYLPCFGSPAKADATDTEIAERTRTCFIDDLNGQCAEPVRCEAEQVYILILCIELRIAI